MALMTTLYANTWRKSAYASKRALKMFSLSKNLICLDVLVGTSNVVVVVFVLYKTCLSV